MKIKYSTCYINRTYKYLAPCMLEYGPQFKIKYENISKLAIGIGDQFYKKDKKAFFILIDCIQKPIDVQNFFDWVENQEYFIEMYPYDNLINTKQMMLVLKIPDSCVVCYDNFKLGHYSKMYTPVQIVKYFYKGLPLKGTKAYEKRVEAREVIQKTDKAKENLIKKIEKEFEVFLTKEETKEMELDFPPTFNKKTEMFNIKDLIL